MKPTRLLANGMQLIVFHSKKTILNKKIDLNYLLIGSRLSSREWNWIKFRGEWIWTLSCCRNIAGLSRSWILTWLLSLAFFFSKKENFNRIDLCSNWLLEENVKEENRFGRNALRNRRLRLKFFDLIKKKMLSSFSLFLKNVIIIFFSGKNQFKNPHLDRKISSVWTKSVRLVGFVVVVSLVLNTEYCSIHGWKWL